MSNRLRVVWDIPNVSCGGMIVCVRVCACVCVGGEAYVQYIMKYIHCVCVCVCVCVCILLSCVLPYA